MAISAADHSRWQGYGNIDPTMLYLHVRKSSRVGVLGLLEGMFTHARMDDMRVCLNTFFSLQVW